MRDNNHKDVMKDNSRPYQAAFQTTIARDIVGRNAMEDFGYHIYNQHSIFINYQLWKGLLFGYMEVYLYCFKFYCIIAIGPHSTKENKYDLTLRIFEDYFNAIFSRITFGCSIRI